MPYETSNGKTIQATKLPQGALWKIEFKPGGALPKTLQGMYTSQKLANDDIEKYLEARAAVEGEQAAKKEAKGGK